VLCTLTSTRLPISCRCRGGRRPSAWHRESQHSLITPRSLRATHGTAPKTCGPRSDHPGSVNPLGRDGLLEFMGWQEAAYLITEASAPLSASGQVTYDLRPTDGARAGAG